MEAQGVGFKRPQRPLVGNGRPPRTLPARLNTIPRCQPRGRPQTSRPGAGRRACASRQRPEELHGESQTRGPRIGERIIADCKTRADSARLRLCLLISIRRPQLRHPVGLSSSNARRSCRLVDKRDSEPRWSGRRATWTQPCLGLLEGASFPTWSGPRRRSRCTRARFGTGDVRCLLDTLQHEPPSRCRSPSPVHRNHRPA